MSLLMEFFLIEYAILLLLGIIFGVGSSLAWFRMGGKPVKKLLLTTAVSERDRIRLQLRDEDGELLLQSPAGFTHVDELKKRAEEIAQRVIVIDENAEGLKG